jgi:hypothetical protein
VEALVAGPLADHGRSGGSGHDMSVIEGIPKSKSRPSSRSGHGDLNPGDRSASEQIGAVDRQVVVEQVRHRPRRPTTGMAGVVVGGAVLLLGRPVPGVAATAGAGRLTAHLSEAGSCRCWRPRDCSSAGGAAVVPVSQQQSPLCGCRPTSPRRRWCRTTSLEGVARRQRRALPGMSNVQSRTYCHLSSRRAWTSGVLPRVYRPRLRRGPRPSSTRRINRRAGQDPRAIRTAMWSSLRQSNQTEACQRLRSPLPKPGARRSGR